MCFQEEFHAEKLLMGAICEESARLHCSGLYGSRWPEENVRIEITK